MNDDTHDILTNHLEMHFIELKKIHIIIIIRTSCAKNRPWKNS